MDRARRGAEFPSRLRGEEIGGVDMVTLDANVAGCMRHGSPPQWCLTELVDHDPECASDVSSTLRSSRS